MGIEAATQAVIPSFRKRRSGTVVNVTSSATLAPFPLVAAYTASKTAVEGFTESLALELEQFDVRVRLVAPGYCPGTRFAENGGPRMQGLLPEAYSAYAQGIFERFGQVTDVTRPIDVAEAVWRAANEATDRLHFPAGADAAALAAAR